MNVLLPLMITCENKLLGGFVSLPKRFWRYFRDDLSKSIFQLKIACLKRFTRESHGRTPPKSKKCDFSHLNKKYTSDFLYFVVFYHISSWQPSGVSWDTGKWIYLNRLENHILADFNVKNLRISKLPLLVNYLWPIPWWYTIGFISTLWTHGASLHFVKVVNFTLFKP